MNVPWGCDSNSFPVRDELSDELVDIVRRQWPVSAEALHHELVTRLTTAKWSLHSALMLVAPASEEYRQINAARASNDAALQLLGVTE